MCQSRMSFSFRIWRICRTGSASRAMQSILRATIRKRSYWNSYVQSRKSITKSVPNCCSNWSLRSATITKPDMAQTECKTSLWCTSGILAIKSTSRCYSIFTVKTDFYRKKWSAQEITTCSSLTAVPNGSIFSPMIIPGISNQFCLKVSSGAYSAPPSLTAAPNWYLHGCWRRTPMCRTGFALLHRNSISPTITGITMSRISLWRPTIRFILWR